MDTSTATDAGPPVRCRAPESAAGAVMLPLSAGPVVGAPGIVYRNPGDQILIMTCQVLPHDTDGAERPTSTVLRREVARSERTHARARGALHGRGPVHRGARHRQPQGHRAQPADRRTSGWTTSRSSTPTWTRSTGPTSAASSPGAASPGRPEPFPAPGTSRRRNPPTRPTGRTYGAYGPRPRTNSPLHASVNSWRTMAGSLLAGVSRTRRRLSLPGRK